MPTVSWEVPEFQSRKGEKYDFFRSIDQKVINNTLFLNYTIRAKKKSEKDFLNHGYFPIIRSQSHDINR